MASVSESASKKCSRNACKKTCSDAAIPVQSVDNSDKCMVVIKEEADVSKPDTAYPRRTMSDTMTEAALASTSTLISPSPSSKRTNAATEARRIEDHEQKQNEVNDKSTLITPSPSSKHTNVAAEARRIEDHEQKENEVNDKSTLITPSPSSKHTNAAAEARRIEDQEQKQDEVNDKPDVVPELPTNNSTDKENVPVRATCSAFVAPARTAAATTSPVAERPTLVTPRAGETAPKRDPANQMDPLIHDETTPTMEAIARASPTSVVSTPVVIVREKSDPLLVTSSAGCIPAEVVSKGLFNRTLEDKRAVEQRLAEVQAEKKELEGALAVVEKQKSKIITNIKGKNALLNKAKAAQEEMQRKVSSSKAQISSLVKENESLRLRLQNVDAVRDDLKNKLRTKECLLSESRTQCEGAERRLKRSMQGRAMERNLLDQYRKLAIHTGYYRWGKQIRALESKLADAIAEAEAEES